LKSRGIGGLGWLAPWLMIAGGGILAVDARSQDSTTSEQAFLASHCVDCHASDSGEGNFDISGLHWPVGEPQEISRWIKVFDKLELGEMPPRDAPQPSEAARSWFIDSLRGKLRDFHWERQTSEGRVVLRRLNRFEYANTLRDLLGISAPLEEQLPEEGRADGFENVGNALHLSVAHLDRYLDAAEQALNEATVSTCKPPTTKIRTDYEETWHDYNHGFQNIQWANAEDGKLAIRWTGSAANGTLRAWEPAFPNHRYRFRFRARAMMQRTVTEADGRKSKAFVHDRSLIAKVSVASLLKDGLGQEDAFFELSPKDYREWVYEARVPEGHSFSLVPYRLVPAPGDERLMSDEMFAVVDWIEIEGPIYDGAWPPIGHRLMYGDLPMEPQEPGRMDSGLQVVSVAPESDARRLIANFLMHAFRRPVEQSEIEGYVELFREQMDLGRSFAAALRAAYKMALTSPQFLFLRESPGELDSYALAARLSYGLWCSSPDAELRHLAATGKLTDSAVLREQTERLLSSPKSQRFIRHFLGGWLNLRDIKFTQPDTKLYPEFDSYLQDSMLAESEQYFDELVQRNHGISHVVDSDFAMLNERLAEHYELKDAFSQAQRLVETEGDFPPDPLRLLRVALPVGSNRGGFITQGAILKVSANGTTTSPVVRGAYVLDRILGKPPDPPPSNVPTVEPDIRGATTIREQLAKHRDFPACSGCHAKLDPPGFALENFDVAGRWRSHYRVIPPSASDKVVKIPGSDVRLYSQGPAVEANYTLENGRSFSDIREFKQILLEDKKQLARCFVGKLMTYLTGATPDFADREVIEQIVSATAPSDYGIRDLIHGVIQSRVFTQK
jgi:hypothetical protein